MNVLLISTYELGRQPFGLASPAAWLREAGFSVTCRDISRDHLSEDVVLAADLVAFFLPMHTATRLAVPLIERVKTCNPAARICCYGIYAPLNRSYLESLGVDVVLGGEFEADLVAVATRYASGSAAPDRSTAPVKEVIPRLQYRAPDRSDLPGLEGYARLALPDGRSVTVGYTEASRGCKHFCRHCPIVPIYNGAFRIIDPEVVLRDVESQVQAGAMHITFGDPDFFNGIRHARRVVREFSRRFPEVSYDVTIKIEHLLRHRDDLTLLRDTGCLFVTSAVESLDDRVLELLDKEHTRCDFERAVRATREAGLSLRPTFVAFTPWTTLETYSEMLDAIDALDLVEEVTPVQYAIRLLITASSRLLELEDIHTVTSAFDPESLTYPWRHADPLVDDLQARIAQLVAADADRPRAVVFDHIRDVTEQVSGVRAARAPHLARAAVPYLTEPWYC